MRQFHLRNLLLLTAVIAVILTWLLREPPKRSGFEVRRINGRAYIVDAKTGLIWRSSISDSGESMDTWEWPEK
jgi:hypothetical protein